MIKEILFGGAGGKTKLADVGLLIARVGAGLLIALGHGRFKLPPSDQFISGVESAGFPAPAFFAWLATFAEFGGGLLLALGLLTRPAAFLIACTMLVAALRVHANDPLFAQVAKGGPSKEMALLFLMPALLFLLAGPGRYSIDAMIRGRTRRSGRGSRSSSQ